MTYDDTESVDDRPLAVILPAPVARLERARVEPAEAIRGGTGGAVALVGAEKTATEKTGALGDRRVSLSGQLNHEEEKYEGLTTTHSAPSSKPNLPSA